MVKRLFIPLIVTACIIALYHFVNIRLFTLDVTKSTRLALFSFVSNKRIDESIVLLNIGKLTQNELQEKVDSLLKCYPRKIGINLCHYDSDTKEFVKHFNGRRSVVIANCNDGQSLSLSRIINDDNTVTHFRTNRKDYFEFKVDHFEGRRHELERIYFDKPSKSFYHWELSNVAFITEYFQGKTVLIGYMGDYLTDSIYYFKNCRVTPLNQYLEGGQPDMYDTEISAEIISSFSGKRFISDVEVLPRILILFLFCVVNVLAITFIKTRWLALNVILAFAVFMALILGAGALIVYLFVSGNYLSLDELPLTLLITSIFTVSIDILEKKNLKN